MNVVNTYGPFKIVNSDFCHSCVILTLTNCTKQYAKIGATSVSMQETNSSFFLFFFLLTVNIF